MFLADKELTFIVNGEIINLDAIPISYFEEEWNNANEFEEIETDKDFFNYNLAVGLAISKSLGSKVFVRHQSGNIVYEAYYNGSFCGYFTVYSDYVSYHSIDNHIYTNLLKDIA